MLITLLTIAIASLAAVPVVIPVVKRLKEALEEGKPLLDDVTSTGEEEDDPVVEEQSLIDLNYVPNFSLELVKKVPKTETLNQKNTIRQDSTTNTLVEVVWQSPGALKPNKVYLQDPVERVRQTPSAAKLHDEDYDQVEALISANPDDPPRLIAPKPIAAPPLAAQRLSSVSFATESDQRSKSSTPSTPSTPFGIGQSKTYQANAEKFKMRPVSDQTVGRRPTAIPMMITAAPTAVKSDQQFEVIKTTAQPKERIFSLLESPEVIASGERVWRSIKPLYLDFSPFFSLDSLIGITPKSRQEFQPNDQSHLRRDRAQRQPSLPSQKNQSDQGHLRNLLGDLNTDREGRLYGGHIANRYHVETNEEDLEWSDLETSDQEVEEDLPEWQSLLGISNHFLFELKLSQQSKVSHQTLTEQSLEDAIVFKITSGSSGPQIESNQQKKSKSQKN